MEVHHHPDLHHKRKKFAEYFLEFIMIFLAVTLGFFAESFREHLSDKSKEREYMKEIVENLKYDTIRCTVNIQRNKSELKGMDSMRTELKKAIEGDVNPNVLYYFALLYGGHSAKAVFNTSAINELKSSGILRLVKNKKLMDQITDYYERKLFATEAHVPSNDKEQQMNAEFFSFLGLDGYVLSFDTISSATYHNVYNYKELLEHTPPLHLLKSDAKEIERLYNSETRFYMAVKNYIFWLNYSKIAATKLIEAIREEYHFEED